MALGTLQKAYYSIIIHKYLPQKMSYYSSIKYTYYLIKRRHVRVRIMYCGK